MDAHKEDEGPPKSRPKPRPKPPPKGAPSILYFVDNIPKDAKELKYKVISHFQKRKRFKGGEVVEEEYQPLGPNSALLLFENADEVSELQKVAHYVDEQKLELYPLVKEDVTLVVHGFSFVKALMSSEKMMKLIGVEELLVTKQNNDFVISGSWKSVQQFREEFHKLMIEELQKHVKKDSSSLFSNVIEATESLVDPQPEDTLSDNCINAKSSSLNVDVLALMQKTGVYQHLAVSYDLQTATININCDDPTMRETIKEEFFSAYREVMMGGKLKEHTFPIDNMQQANVMVDECAKTFNHTYFRYDPEKKEIKCLSTDARQMQNVRRKLGVMKSKAEALKGPKVKVLSIDLPKLSRRVTIKLANIVDEEVDIIVNAANDRLMHVGGVAAAIDKASYGAVQRESSKLIEHIGTLQTGSAAITTAGGKLKCKFVVHAVGPMFSKHKDQCRPLLHSACVNSMALAQQNKAKSISFPPISSGIYGVPKELVANVMLSTLCSYTCSDPELLNDVRIVIIDEPTFDVFQKIFHKEKENLELLQDTKFTATKSATTQYNMQIGNSPQLGPQKGSTDIAFINLSKQSRRITLKCGNIVQEEVDVIVNSANNHLNHEKGVAAAINEASGGAVERESTKIIQSKVLVPTGDAVATAAGGTLKCKFVVHAVGPIASQHSTDQCSALLMKACLNAMNVAANFEAISVAFPPISSGECGVLPELVANVMLTTLCGYECSNPTLLSDVRIVIIDQPTFEVFLNVFHRERQSLDQIYNNPTTTSSTFLRPATFHHGWSTGNITSFPGFAKGTPGGHTQPLLYSQALSQLTLQANNSTSLGTSNAQSTDPFSPTGQGYNQAMMGTEGDTSSIFMEDIESPPVRSEPKHDSNDPGNAQGSFVSDPTLGQKGDSINATSSTTTGVKGSNDNTKDEKHSKDILIDKYKEASNEENSTSNRLAFVNMPPNNDSSMDPVSKPASDNANSSLQPTATDPLNHANKHEGISDEQHGPSPEASLKSAAQTHNVSVSANTKHIPPWPAMATNDNQTKKQNSEATGNNQAKKQNSEVKDKSKEKKKDNNEKTEDCPICLEKLKDKPVTAISTCKHCKQDFCKGCLHEALQYKPYCPACTLPLRKVTGNQPPGTMTMHTFSKQKLPGYEKYGTIQINYHIPSGKQGKEHPNPGQHFQGTSRTAYVPDSIEGRKVAQLLKKAFDARLIFTVGTSHTSGITNIVVWNDIHHKTSMSGGPTNYGYPDPTYLSRVLEELAAKGIKE